MTGCCPDEGKLLLVNYFERMTNDYKTGHYKLC